MLKWGNPMTVRTQEHFEIFKKERQKKTKFWIIKSKSEIASNSLV